MKEDKNLDEQIKKKFEQIRNIADNYLNLTHPEASDPDRFMDDIENKLAEYKLAEYEELIQPRCAGRR